MSNPSLIWRANQNSSLYNTIKARNSKQNAFDYAVQGEKNICPVARSKIIVNPTTSMNATAQQVVKFQLPNHGILNDLYLQTKFISAQDTNVSSGGANDGALVEFAGAFATTQIRLVYNGATVWECTPEWIMCDAYTKATKEKASQLDAMLGGGILGAANDTLASVTGRRLAFSCGGGITLGCPLKGFWSDGLGRGLDLYSLSSPMFLEVSYRANSECHEILDTAAKAADFSDANLVAYISELAPEELSAYQSRNYAPGSVSSQLGFTTTKFSESISSPVLITGSSTTGNKVKIQSISGLVRRLYVFATLDSDRSSSTAKKYMNTVPLARVQLKANNQTIYELENSSLFDAEHASTSNGYKTDGVIEQYHNNLPFSAGPHATAGTIEADMGIAENAGGSFDPSHIQVFNFGFNPDDHSSADGSLSFSQLGNPELEVMFNTSASTNAHTLHIIAETLTINTYNTSANGQINFKMITE